MRRILKIVFFLLVYNKKYKYIIYLHIWVSLPINRIHQVRQNVRGMKLLTIDHLFFGVTKWLNVPGSNHIMFIAPYMKAILIFRSWKTIKIFTGSTCNKLEMSFIQNYLQCSTSKFEYKKRWPDMSPNKYQKFWDIICRTLNIFWYI